MGQLIESKNCKLTFNTNFDIKVLTISINSTTSYGIKKKSANNFSIREIIAYEQLNNPFGSFLDNEFARGCSYKFFKTQIKRRGKKLL